MSLLRDLSHYEQAIWLDFLERDFVTKGGLEQLIKIDSVKGVTSNPAIFEKAIGSSPAYDDAVRLALADRDKSASELFEEIAVQDIRAAADVLDAVYRETRGADGFVSLEVSPYLAHDTDGTIAEAERLWLAVDRRNLMVKVPATAAGIAAIEALIGRGININVTLLFSREVYRQVAEAYIRGLDAFVARGGDPSAIASVASFFISRIDAVVDAELERLIAATSDPQKQRDVRALLGTVAIANARMAYQDSKKVFSGKQWVQLAAKGAKPQRLLWASTGTKNKNYRDTLYVEELIGPDTVNTVPPATLDAFRDHGKPRSSLEENIGEAETTLAAVDALGISLERIAGELTVDGVQQFVDAADKLYGAVARKRASVLGSRLNTMTASLAPELSQAFERAIEEWRQDERVRRLWRKDASLWTGTDESKWLGWLDSIETEQQRLLEYAALAGWVRSVGFTDVVVLGMGGSSLGPDVLSSTFPRAPGYPRLHVLDSTSPDQVRAMADGIDLSRALIIVSSKSGGTVEPNVTKDYFQARIVDAVGKDRVGECFVAVTDPGSSLEAVASMQRFARIFHGDPQIGGRYSLFSPFGLVPAAAAGLDIEAWLSSARHMVRSCAADVPPAQNPGVQLGLILGCAGLAGRDKITITASTGIVSFGGWAEQLIAESTGKRGKGLIPIDVEDLGSPKFYGEDRIFIDLALAGEADENRTARLSALEKAGHPVVRIVVRSTMDLAQEFYRFEIATAVAGAVLGIHPFDQPDVESAKVKTRELLTAFEATGDLPAEEPEFLQGPLAVYTNARNIEMLVKASRPGDIAGWLRAHLQRAGKGDYVALLAYLQQDEANTAALQRMRMIIRDARRVATCTAFGPRFLHSTGQAHKGGPDTGVFLEITADPVKDVDIPGRKASFGTLIAAQARGDFGVLMDRDRRAMRVHISGDPKTGLASLQAALCAALM
jgi:transaldolase/glucose-6-phosphate isomerase